MLEKITLDYVIAILSASTWLVCDRKLALQIMGVLSEKHGSLPERDGPIKQNE